MSAGSSPTTLLYFDPRVGHGIIETTLTDLLWEQNEYFGAWQEAKEFLSGLQGRYVFRGMRNAEWNLETSLDRIARYRYAESERLLIDSFMRAAPTIIHDPPQGVDLFSWLALMRHYGLPTRLLDCTESLWVAAYFAVEPPPDSGRDVGIWAFDKDAIQRSAEASLGILSSADTLLSPLELGTNDLFSVAFNSRKRFVALVDAKHRTERQRAQQALFLCPGDPEYPFWRNLHGIAPAARTPGSLYRLVLPCGARDTILADLSGRDIDQAQLLPDIDDIEKICSKLGVLREQSQQQYGHFQWKVAVKPMLMKRGLLEISAAVDLVHDGG